MPPDIICLGELLAEVIRTEVDIPHRKVGLYKGPFPSGAPAIFIDCAARMSKPLKFSTCYIGVIGDDDFRIAIDSPRPEDLFQVLFFWKLMSKPILVFNKDIPDGYQSGTRNMPLLEFCLQTIMQDQE